MSEKDDRTQRIRALASTITDRLDTDIVYFSGMVNFGDDKRLLSQFPDKKRRKNLLLLLSTFGGSADAAYRFTRCIQETYKQGKFSVFVHTFCKSAGTLIALGAHEVVMSDGAELGPLDVQIRKPDEIDERMSGLTPMQALSTLRAEAYQAFEHFFGNIRRNTGFTSRTAGEIAASLTTGLFASIYGQLEPMRLGENDRAMRIGEEYGRRLTDIGKNLHADALLDLITAYPSHEFVIDRSEAGKLFKRIRSPEEDEWTLASLLEPYGTDTLFDDERHALVELLRFYGPDEEEGDDKNHGDGSDATASEQGRESLRASNTPSGNGDGQAAPNGAESQPESAPDAVHSGDSGVAN
jgi:hypothetical protein